MGEVVSSERGIPVNVGLNVGRGASSRNCTGVFRSQENATPWDPTVGLFLGSYDGPRGKVFSYERDTPVGLNVVRAANS